MRSSNPATSQTSRSLHASGRSPHKSRSVSAQISERKDNVELLLAQELDGSVIEIDRDHFFKTFLAGNPGALARACLNALQDPSSKPFHETIEAQITAELDALERGKEKEKKKEIETETEMEMGTDMGKEEGKEREKKKEKGKGEGKEKKHPDASSLKDDATEDAIRTAIWDAIRGRLPTYDEDNKQFSLLANVNSEEELYKPLASLLTFINYFYRNYLGDKDGVDEIDKAWPKATQPWSPMDGGSDGASPTESKPPSQNWPTHYLRRRFIVSDKVPRYTRSQDRDAFKPDLALVVQQSEDPRPPNLLGWKDIKVAIEVKRRIQTPHLQTARYALCMKREQFDRSVFFTLTITGREFRIARWDSAGCYVTPNIDFYQKPLYFIHVVGRLACMTPEQLGYDQTFSNAGRVLHFESTQSNRGIRTTLEITPCEAVEDLRESPGTESHKAIKPTVRYLLDDDLLCDARDLLFCRSTRVWRAQLITELGPSPSYNAIKQNWHDEDRINEAWFYEETKDIEHGVAHMIAFEDLDRTRRASSMIESRHVHATWTQASKTKTILQRQEYEEDAPAVEGLCHRVLVRFVLKEVGLPLSRIKTPRQLVHVIHDIAMALEALYDRNILHRDISEGNILLSADENAVSGNRAFLTDFGLAMRIDPSTKLPLPSSVEHDHITGTLPFIATIFHNVTEPYTPLSIIHHDVESLFWVAMYTVFKFASCEPSQTMSKQEEGAITKCGDYLAVLRSTQLRFLYPQKQSILTIFQDVPFPGRWLSVQNLLSKVASVCGARFLVALTAIKAAQDPDPKNHDLRTIISAADALSGDSIPGLDERAPPPLPRSGSRSTSQLPGQSERAISTSAASKGKRRREGDNATYQGRNDNNLSGTRERSKRSRKEASSEADQEL